jgi:peptidyl-prolyl cis-trans isomerase D
MMKFLRSQSQTVLIGFLVVMGLGFLFYGNAGNLLTSQGGHVSNDYGRIDGQDLTVSELYAAVRSTRNAAILQGQAQQLNQPGGRSRLAEDAWRQLLIAREADKLHIQISDDELLDFIRNRPYFQKDGVFNPDLYKSQMAQIQVILRLPADPNGDPIAPAAKAYEDYARNSLRSQAVFEALFSTVRGSPQQLSEQYEKYYGPADVSVVTFDPSTVEKTVQVSDDDIAAEYKAHPMNPDYRTKEKRNIDYVYLALTPDQAKLTGKDKAAAINALGEKALDFALAFQPEPAPNSTTPPPMPDFNTEAKKRGFTPVTTGFFTIDTPPTGLPPSTSFNTAAFDLTKDNPISKVVQMDNGVAVLHLAEIQASDLIPLDQVKAQIQKTLLQAKEVEAEQKAAQDAATALRAAVAKGTDFKTAAAALSLKVETPAAFVPMKVAQNDPKMQVVAYVTTTLSPGQVSEAAPIQGSDSMVIVYLNSRAKADPAGLADFIDRVGTKENQQLRELVFFDWANWASKQPGTHRPPELDAYGGVE